MDIGARRSSGRPDERTQTPFTVRQEYSIEG
jgi:hypothetical protein